MTIAQVAKRYELTTDTLRYYERVGLLPSVQRTASGIRDYTEDDCNWVGFIKCMRSAGVSVETLAEYVRLFRQGPETAAARKELLLAQRAEIAARIAELTEVLHRLDVKLDGYEETVLKCEEGLK